MAFYTYRQYREGDEWEINRVYGELTGRKRSREEYIWQWFRAPGGAGEIWIIETDFGNECKRLIGHHGVMPIRFCKGMDDLLFGKTENTFVHPDYRKKILYPRFESRFRKEYEGRFHGLFSTMGPVRIFSTKEFNAAIRQRKAQGYKICALWKKFIWGVRPMSSAVYLGSKLVHQIFPRLRNPPVLRSEVVTKGSFRRSGVKITCYNRQEARGVDLFKTYWPEVRKKYGVTPSREYKDLRWRFWDNPYISYYTLVLDSPTIGTGIAIVSNLVPGLLKVEDFVVEHPQSKAFGRLFEALLAWAGGQGVYSVEFTTTDDSIAWIGKENFSSKAKNLKVGVFFNKLRGLSVQRMPRKICDRGKSVGVQKGMWYITPIVFE